MNESLTAAEQESRLTKYQSLPLALRRYWFALCILIALGFFATMIFTRVLHHNQYPYSDTLLPPRYNNEDFTCFQDRFRHFRSVGFFESQGQPFNYPAPVAIVYEAFYGFSSHPVARFVEFSSICYLAAALLFAGSMTRRGLRPATAFCFSLSMLLLSYPFMLEFLLSNIEFAVWLFLALGIWAYAKEKTWSAAVCFGLAASMKIYPLVFLGLSLAKKQYKQAVLAAGVFAVSSIGSLYLLGPSIRQAYSGLKEGVLVFRLRYIFTFNPLESGIDHSLFGVVKFSVGLTKHLRWLPNLAGPYLVVVASIGIFLYFWKIRYLPPFNQVLALTIACVLLPPVSHDYTLIHLYGPFVMLVLLLLERPAEAMRRGTVPMLVAFALLFSPENYLVVHDLRLGGPFKAILLVLLMFMSLRFPVYPSPRLRMHQEHPA